MDDAKDLWSICERLLQLVPFTTVSDGMVVKTLNIGGIDLLSSFGALLDIWVGTKVFSMWQLSGAEPDLVCFKRGGWIADCNARPV